MVRKAVVLKLRFFGTLASALLLASTAAHAAPVELAFSGFSRFDSFDPLPAALPLFTTGLGALGLARLAQEAESAGLNWQNSKLASGADHDQDCTDNAFRRHVCAL
jgi:hypothetical protein